MATSDIVGEVDDVTVPDVGVVHVPVVKGDFTHLPLKVQEFIATYVSIENNAPRFLVKKLIFLTSALNMADKSVIIVKYD